MIEAIKANNIDSENDKLFVEIGGGVILSVIASDRDIEFYTKEKSQRPQEQTAGAPPTVYTNLETVGDTMELVGFSSPQRRELYLALKAVEGVGRKSALTILSYGEIIDILRAVSAKDKTFLSEVPKIGDKRIAAIFKRLALRYDRALPKPLKIPVLTWVEARDALMQDGFSFDNSEVLLHAVVDNFQPKKKAWEAEELYSLAKEAHNSANNI